LASGSEEEDEESEWKELRGRWWVIKGKSWNGDGNASLELVFSVARPT